MTDQQSSPEQLFYTSEVRELVSKLTKDLGMREKTPLLARYDIQYALNALRGQDSSLQRITGRETAEEEAFVRLVDQGHPALIDAVLINFRLLEPFVKSFGEKRLRFGLGTWAEHQETRIKRERPYATELRLLGCFQKDLSLEASPSPAGSPERR